MNKDALSTDLYLAVNLYYIGKSEQKSFPTGNVNSYQVGLELVETQKNVGEHKAETG